MSHSCNDNVLCFTTHIEEKWKKRLRTEVAYVDYTMRFVSKIRYLTESLRLAKLQLPVSNKSVKHQVGIIRECVTATPPKAPIVNQESPNRFCLKINTQKRHDTETGGSTWSLKL